MGTNAAGRSAGPTVASDRMLAQFAGLMWDRYGADIYLFGSRARGAARPDSDYDIVAVAEAFAGQPWFRRCPDAGDLWLAAGGWRIGLDLQCYTPSEFRGELSGLGYLGQAMARGELVKIEPI